MSRRICSFLLCLGAAAAIFFSGGEAQAAIGADWCTHATAQRLEGDINGDGQKDLLCHDLVTGQKWVALKEATGYEQRWQNATLAWCTHAGAKLYLGDVNGDGRADLVCKDPQRIWLDYADNSFYTGTNWDLFTPWCTHAGSSFFLADQNSDLRADLVCRDTAGTTTVDYADGSGRFLGTDASAVTLDLEVTNIVQGASSYTVWMRNNGAQGLVTRVQCSHASYLASRTVSTTVAMGGTVTVFITSLPIFPGTVTCSASGVGPSGAAELFLSNNTFSRYF